ncbi:G patch domain and ankyrin repeat-containing protein 1 [Lingula anatina]|uniref:G patch domain and ankyrin repeat-containing protein 1 n=1 Tax=Lingula anatina TaxID=7574 RepID=A0A1S3IWH6_LINAN|nr:G patch domain and ankyrin repeat-containing protein 1 [Lingula anatina]XP_013401904.1 G patch domain and ankyrin repeat-containing protein 1 [Lingula anatina]XP_013401905.1 G patch domain and ankyrin repeat-containing protein 1 [Lingula anatina]|eukprot:XP_013401903.1 G patch domain and ankyrin repeat-containing protein 1 [Lingula anatina]
MSNFEGRLIHSIDFVPENKDVASKSKPKEASTINSVHPSINGREARSFYEEVVENVTDKKVGTSSLNRPKEKPKNKHHSNHKPSIKPSLSHLNNSLLKYAQMGELQSVQKCLQDGAELDHQDGYGWTALMCAAHAGQIQVVQYLMTDAGANVYICDKQGQMAIDLAIRGKQTEICKILRDGNNQSDDNDDDSQTLQETFYCNICKLDFQETTRANHETSTLHLFNSKRKPPGTLYFIPESNKGYQMMVKHGWDKEMGLGTQGQGQKFPVKTVLKRDRLCLGAKTEAKSKVTHFNACDTSAVKHPKKEDKRKMRHNTKNKMIAEKRLKKDKHWEQNLRRYMDF